MNNMRSLISAFFIRLLEGSVSKLAKDEISILYLVSEADQTRLGCRFVINPEDRFSRNESHFILTKF